jgi:hypothetical protein
LTASLFGKPGKLESVFDHAQHGSTCGSPYDGPREGVAGLQIQIEASGTGEA